MNECRRQPHFVRFLPMNKYLSKVFRNLIQVLSLVVTSLFYIDSRKNSHISSCFGKHTTRLLHLHDRLSLRSALHLKRYYTLLICDNENQNACIPSIYLQISPR